MIMTPIKPANSPDRPKLDTLEDAVADLETSGAFSRAAVRLIGNVREYLKMTQGPIATSMLGDLNDLETLLVEARYKSDVAQRAVLAFHESEFEARSLGKG